MKKILIVVLAFILAFAMFGCQKEELQPTTEATNAPSETTDAPSETMLSGTVDFGGSTSVQPVLEALAEEFMALYPNVTITYNGTGSSTGVSQANEGAYMIGAASRNIKDSEKEYGMTEKVLAYDGIAVVVNPAVDVDELTMEQIQMIYKGEITDWSEVGGTAGAIMVVSREDGSGTRGAYEEIIGFEDELTADAAIAEGNGGVKSTVAENPSAIGYVSFTYLDETIRDLLVNGGKADVASVLDGSYPVSRPFMLIWHDKNLDEIGKSFIAFIDTDEAKVIIEDAKAIPLS